MAECLVAYVVAFYYNVIIAWSLYYLIASFTKRLPWTYCGNHYNTPYCYDGSSNTTIIDNQTVFLNASNSVTSATEFFEWVTYTETRCKHVFTSVCWIQGADHMNIPPRSRVRNAMVIMDKNHDILLPLKLLTFSCFIVDRFKWQAQFEY